MLHQHNSQLTQPVTPIVPILLAMKNIFKTKFMQNEAANQAYKFPPSSNGLLNIEDMQKTILREKARSDRRDHDFSVIVINTQDLRNGKDLDHFIQLLCSRLRSIDEIGWYDINQIGIVLPYTSSSNALQVAEDLIKINRTSSPIKLETILTYPSIWPYNNR